MFLACTGQAGLTNNRPAITQRRCRFGVPVRRLALLPAEQPLQCSRAPDDRLGRRTAESAESGFARTQRAEDLVLDVPGVRSDEHQMLVHGDEPPKRTAGHLAEGLVDAGGV